jgi:DNA-binding response OmpR family regulator
MPGTLGAGAADRRVGQNPAAMQDARILVVDDDPDVRGLVRELLEREGARVVDARNGREALRLLYDVRPDVVVLDVLMPELDGWQTLERIRDLSEVPVLMLTARDTEPEKVRGLQSGADDYVTKPFGRQELLARVEVLLRRASALSLWGDHRETYADGRLTVDVPRAEARVDDRVLTLTPLEFRLLLAFLRNPGQVLSRDQLLDLVWGDPGAVSPAQVKITVSLLRRKLSAGPGEPDRIETVRGFGYRWRREG